MESLFSVWIKKKRIIGVKKGVEVVVKTLIN